MTTLRLTTLLLLAALTCWGDSTTTNSPSANDAAWTTSDNAHSQSDTYSEGTFNVTVSYTGFGFSGLTGTIDGVTVAWDAFKDGTLNNTLDVNLLNAGTCSLKASGVLATSDTDSYTSMGSTSDTWSCTALTPAAVNSSSFGVSVNATKSSGPNPNAASWNLDHIRVTVEYTPAAAGKRKVVVVSGDD